MSNDSKHNWQWRPATEADVGRLARFCDDEEFECADYGILRQVCPQNPNGEFYMWFRDSSSYVNCYHYCEVQYDANEEPL